jgi:hypothetical protein
MSANTLGFLLSVIHLFEESDLSVWVFGGWAEEIWQIIPGRMHNDIDFLYPATTFEHLDRFMAQANDFQEITAKRFSHKRAMLYQDVMIEFVLVQGDDESYFTDFFSGRYRLVWPVDVFGHRASIPECNIPIASVQALTIYRQHHERIEEAYQDFLTTRWMWKETDQQI